MADEVRYDVDGYNILTDAMRELINLYPGLDEDDEFSFATLGDDRGKAMFPVSGAVIESEQRSILDHVTQTCLYPMYIVYRAAGLSEERKAKVKEWLDNLGRWLERQTITIDDTEYHLDEYPPLTGDRKFTMISRTTPAYLEEIDTNNSENWVIYITARYTNEYDL